MGAMCAFLEVDVLQQLRCITRQITLQSAMGARCAVLEVDVLQQLRCVIRQITRQFNRILCCSLPFFAYASLWVVFLVVSLSVSNVEPFRSVFQALHNCILCRSLLMLHWSRIVRFFSIDQDCNC